MGVVISIISPWQQAKEIIKMYPTCSFYNQTWLPEGSNPKGMKRNKIWEKDVFYFMEFCKLKYVHHTIDTYLGFQWVTALSLETVLSAIIHLLEVMDGHSSTVVKGGSGLHSVTWIPD